MGCRKSQHALGYLIIYAIGITTITGILGALYFYTPDAPTTQIVYAQPPFVGNSIIVQQHPTFENAILTISVTNAQIRDVDLQPTDFSMLLERLECAQGTVAVSRTLDDSLGYIEATDLAEEVFTVPSRREFYVHVVCPYIFARDGLLLTGGVNIPFTSTTRSFAKLSKITFENVKFTESSGFTQIGIVDGGDGSVGDPSQVFSFCGDATCDAGETLDSCPIDCAVCGDGICSSGETPDSCGSDCGLFSGACSDLSDNDGDGFVDLDDPGCIDAFDLSELGLVACDDGVDNDLDTLIDYEDPGCIDPLDDSEADPVFATECSDGVDNDGDGLIDVLDPGCLSPSDDSESEALALAECADGIDNDGDGLIDWGFTSTSDPHCGSAFDNEAAYDPDYFQLELFPDFNIHSSLSVVLWGNNLLPEQQLLPLDKGYTHLHYIVDEEAYGTLPVESRYWPWTGINRVYNGPGPEDDEPWVHKMPWNNDLDEFKNKWWWYARGQQSHFEDSDYLEGGDGFTQLLEAELTNMNVEAQLGYPFWEQFLFCTRDETNPGCYQGMYMPQEYLEKNPDGSFVISDEQFADEYKREMAKLYYEPLKYIREEWGYTGRLGYYIDTPIHRAYWQIPLRTWDEWITDRSLVNYLYFDWEDDGPGFYDNWGPTYYAVDAFQPSAYIFAHEDPRWLSFVLFQIEANKAWIPDDADIVQHLWLEYNFNPSQPDTQLTPLEDYMAHGLAIFPFFSGAQGIQLFYATPEVQPFNGGELIRPQDERFWDNYMQFTYGLYRLSQYNEFFEPGYELVSTNNPRDEWVDISPIWRGIKQGNELLVAAHNPAADWDEVTVYDIEYNGQIVGNIQTTGKEIYLDTLTLPPINGGFSNG